MNERNEEKKNTNTKTKTKAINLKTQEIMKW